MTTAHPQPDAGDCPAAFPPQGEAGERLLAAIREATRDDWPWQAGRSFALVYDLDDEHTELISAAYRAMFSANAVSPTAFPSAALLEREVIEMVADLLHAPVDARGAMTSGGSESTILALKACRDHARHHRPDITAPRIVLPRTAHAAFLKAAYYLDLIPVIVEVDAAGRAPVDAMAQAIDDRTILLIGSAPCLPFGTCDPIEGLAALAQQRGLPLHIDACLGGFMLPFMADLGYDTPPFDFELPGVSSITVDLHKYAFAAKGASVTIYRDADLFAHQWYQTEQWTSGSFASGHMTGTRPGGAVAAAWTALRALGRAGYQQIATTVMETTRRLRAGIEAIDGLRIVGQPDMSVFAFTSDHKQIGGIVERMAERGWRLNRQANPPAIHMIITPRHAGVVEPFCRDLAEAVAEAGQIADNSEAAEPVAVYGLPMAEGRGLNGRRTPGR